MEYTVNFKGADKDEDWNEGIQTVLKSYATELKNIVNMYYSLRDFEDIELPDPNKSDLENDYILQHRSSFELYKYLFHNFFKRFGIYCELNNLHITIKIKKNGIEYKNFKHNYIFELKNNDELYKF